nr:MAG TPA: hypothetical protein [Caudoviricetes sp.]
MKLGRLLYAVLKPNITLTSPSFPRGRFLLCQLP